MNDMLITRRFFIGGAGSFAALGPRALFAAKPGTFDKGLPELTFGVLSDVHVCLAKGGGSLEKNHTTAHLEKAFAFFRDNGADAVVIAGDMAHSGLVGEHRAVAEAWARVFPGDKAPDGRPVAHVFVYGNHEWSSAGRAAAVFADEAERRANYLSVDPKKHWADVFHEDWTPFFVKNVKGYDFVGCHWHVGGCCGKNEVFTQGMGAFYDSIKAKLDPKKPFFHIQHPHPKGTVHGENVWGQDTGASTKTLSQFPNAIAFSGHSHSTLVDERAIWQGAFTSVGTASLRDLGGGCFASGVAQGYENWKSPSGPEAKAMDELKAMQLINRFDAKQGQIVRVFKDRVVFSRRDFANDLPLGEDWVMPLPAAESKPFAFDVREAKAVSPKFASGAALRFATDKVAGRRPRKGAGKRPVVDVYIPPALAEKSAIGVRYIVRAAGADGQPLEVAVLADAYRFAPASQRVQSPTKCRIFAERLAKGEVKFEVRAYSVWGRPSEPLKGRFRI